MRLPGYLKDILPTERVKQWIELVNQPGLASGLKDMAAQMGLKEVLNPQQLQQAVLQTKRWVETVADRFQRPIGSESKIGLNASGQLFTNRFAWLPMPSQTAAHASMIASHSIETDPIIEGCRKLLIDMSGANTAFVTHSVEQSLLTLSFAIPTGKRWLIAARDCMRLQTGADVAQLLGAQSSEVISCGASNNCSIDDYKNAITNSDSIGGLLFLTSTDSSNNEWIAELSEIANSAKLPLVELMIAGSVQQLTTAKIAIPSAVNSLKRPIDAVIVAGDAWLGGPASGIVLGKTKFAESWKSVAKKLGTIADPFKQSMLTSTLSVSDSQEKWEKTNLGAIVCNSLENLEQRAKKLMVQLDGLDHLQEVTTGVADFAIGSLYWDNIRLPSAYLKLKHKTLSAELFRTQLNNRPLPIWTNTDPDSVTIVLRTIDPADDAELVNALSSAI